MRNAAGVVVVDDVVVAVVDADGGVDLAVKHTDNAVAEGSGRREASVVGREEDVVVVVG